MENKMTRMSVAVTELQKYFNLTLITSNDEIDEVTAMDQAKWKTAWKEN